MSELSSFLAPRLNELIQRWIRSVDETIAPEGLPESVLRDHVGEVLRALVASLDRGLVPETIVFAKEHGKQRYAVGFQVKALVHEYGLLRSLIFDLAAEANLTRPLEELRLVTDFVSVAIAEGVAEYDDCRSAEQRERERLLTEARLLSDSALTAGSVGAFTWDIETDRVHGDASFSKLFGIRLDEKGAAPLADYVAAMHPDDRAATTAKIQETLDHGGLYDAEYRIVIDGGVRWVAARGRVDRQTSGRPVRFPGVLIDITGRKVAEEAQHALTARLATALDVGGLGAFEWDVLNDTLELDDRAREIFAFGAHESITSEAIFGRIDPRDRAGAQAQTEAGLASKPRMRAEYWLAIPGRPSLAVLSFGEILRNSSGQAIRMVGVFRDVTEERSAVEQLRRSEERMRRIVEASGAGLWDLDVASGAIEADARMVELMGQPAGPSFALATGIDGLPCAEDRERVAAAVADAVAGKNGGQYQMEFRTGGRDDVPLRWVESRARATCDASGMADHLSGAMIDITARKRAEAEGDFARARIEELLESIDEAVISVAPDWRITRVNRRFEQISRRIHGDAVGKDLWSLVPDDIRTTTQYWAQYHRTMLERVTTSFVEYYAPLDTWTDVHAYPTSDGGMTAFLRDISAERRAEVALQASEERYRTLFNAIDEGFCLVEMVGGAPGERLDYRFLEVNRAFESQSGLQNALHKSMRELQPEHEELWFETYRRVADTGEPVRFESEAKALGRWFEAYANRIGRPEERQVAIVFKDITARKQAERERAELLSREQAARAEAELARLNQHELFMQAPVAIAIFEGWKHRFAFANPLYRRFFEGRDVVGLLLDEAAPELRGQAFGKLLDQVMATAEPLVANEMVIELDPTNTGRHEENLFDFTYSPKHDPMGTVNGVMVAAVDVTERVKARRRIEALIEQLRRSEERYRTLFESIDEGFCLIEVLFDEDGKSVDYRYLQVNAAFEAQSGLRDPIGKTIREMVPTIEPFWPELFGRVVASGEPARMENPATGMGRWFDVRACRVGPAEQHQVVVLFSDVTERKVLEAERERLLTLETRAREIAEEASRLKDEFLATVSHELRTPLNAMLGWVQMLRSGRVQEDRKERALETIERNARSQAQLIEDLLDMSRILSGKMRLELEPLDLSNVVGAALESIRPSAIAKGIRLQPILDSGGVVVGDPNRLQQVVWNLLSNAIKFTPKGGRVQVIVQCLDSAVELSVADTGQGISRDFLPHVFERFRQAEGGTSRAKGGLGLGLSIVRQLIEMHGGTITVSSDGEGKGASFTVVLPLSVTRRRGPDVPLALLPSSTNSMAPRRELEGLRLLVVDDEEDAREMLAAMLESSGAFVEKATSASEARQLFTARRPDVVVSDIGMPGENGYAFLASIRSLSLQDGGNVPAVALTAYARSEDRTKALTAGFTSHIAKPIEAAELIAVISTLARQARVART